MPLALPTVLSQVLVARTIELDNEAEHRLTHRTSPGASHTHPGSSLATGGHPDGG
jgi:hypothetical protein